MPEIQKTFRCPMCERRMTVWIRSDEPDPLCPYGCSEEIQGNPESRIATQTEWVPGKFAVTTHKAKAIDIAQNVIEQDFGVTNFSDNQREGDIAFKAEPETREKRDEKEKVVDTVRTGLSSMAGQQAEQAMRNLGMKSPAEFWGSGKGFSVAAGDVMASAKGTVTPDINPMRILHKGVQEGKIGEPVKNFRPLAKA